MKMIRDYLVTHGGKVHTQMLIDHFNRYCGTPRTYSGVQRDAEGDCDTREGSREEVDGCSRTSIRIRSCKVHCKSKHLDNMRLFGSCIAGFVFEMDKFVTA
jgi:hypothetical protein